MQSSRVSIEMKRGIRLIFAGIMLLGLSACSSDGDRADIAAGLVVEVREHERLLVELEKAGYGPAGRDALGKYLAEARRNGVASQADLRIKLNALERNTARVLALIDVYEPTASNEDFKAAARAFRSYGLAWLDREDALIELYMLGGGYGVSAAEYPKTFLKLAEAEAGG